jgi:UDP-4-amino-4,6-dideoxy-N-acetyl-beta-L-altrosamine N-acetyltransferase
VPKNKLGLVRKMREQDLDKVLVWRNHIEVRRFMFHQKEITFEEHREWFERVSGDTCCHLLIFELEGVPSGSVKFNQYATALVADWGFYLSPDAEKGVGRQLGWAALDYAFGELGLHKVCGEALAFNDRSIQFHLNLGFRQEGILRDQHFDGQKFHNVVSFGLLSNEWNQNREEDS